MLKFWIISIIITLIFNKLTNIIINNKIESMGYIAKSQKISKGKFIFSSILDFIPFLNLIITLLNVILIGASLKNNKLFNETIKDIKHLPENVIFNYNRNYISKKQLEDILILDGADKKTINEEIKKLDKYENGFATKEKGFFGMSFLDEKPSFNEKDYNKARAQELANQFIFEVECNKNLKKEEKAKYLRNVKKVFLDELNNKKTVKPITKVLK